MLEEELFNDKWDSEEEVSREICAGEQRTTSQSSGSAGNRHLEGIAEACRIISFSHMFSLFSKMNNHRYP